MREFGRWCWAKNNNAAFSIMPATGTQGPMCAGKHVLSVCAGSWGPQNLTLNPVPALAGRRTRFVFVPGPGNPGSGDVLNPNCEPCACRCGQANTRFVFVPGPGDPGPGDVLPRPPLPAALTGALRAAVPSAEFASNPCRLRHYMQVCSGCRAACCVDYQNQLRKCMLMYLFPP